MHALINIDHPEVDDETLRTRLQRVYRQPEGDNGTSFVEESSVVASHGSGVIWHSFQPRSKVVAHCIRHAQHRMEVIVEIQGGGELFEACEIVLEDLGAIFRIVSRGRFLKIPIPFSGKGVTLDKIDILQSNSYPSGMRGTRPDLWSELKSKATLGTVLPGLLTIGLSILVIFLIGDDWETRALVSSISPASLVAFGIMFSWLESRKPVRWRSP